MLVLRSESFFLKAKSLAFVAVSYWCPLVLYLELDINDMTLEKAIKYYSYNNLNLQGFTINKSLCITYSVQNATILKFGLSQHVQW